MLAQALLHGRRGRRGGEGEEPDPPREKEIFWGGLAFVIVFTLLAWKAWPAIKKALQDREDKIRGDLEHAESVRNQAETELADYQRQLADARNEAGRDHRGGPPVGRAGAQGPHRPGRGGRRRDPVEGSDDIRAASERAMADIQGKVSDLSIELAERIVQQNLDRATQIQLIENYINEVGGTRPVS